MKAFVVLAVLVAVASAGHLGGIAIANTGSSISTRSEDGLGNYKFGYNEQHATGGSSRSEAGNPWGVVGSYTLNGADGRARVVNYVADKLGFRASIKTNEPGTSPDPAAATSIVAPVAAQKHIGVVAPVAAVAAPIGLGVAKVAAPIGLGVGLGGVGLGLGGVGLGGVGIGGLGLGGIGLGGLGVAKVAAGPVAIAAPLGAAYSTSVLHAAPLGIGKVW